MSARDENSSKKRLRTDEDGNSVSTGTSTIPPLAPSTAQAPVGSNLPSAWLARVLALQAGETPPQGVLQKFVALYSESLSGFQRAVRAHFSGKAARDRFAELSEGGAIPPEIARAFKVPPFQFPAVAGASGTVAVAKDLEALNIATTNAQQLAIVYVMHCHDAQVAATERSIDIAEKKNELRLELRAYSVALLEQGGLTLALWHPYIEAVTEALGDELTRLKMHVLATLAAERASKAEQLAALSVANADAEMVDGTKTVNELVDEKLAKFLSDWKSEHATAAPTKKKKVAQQTNATASSSGTNNQTDKTPSSKSSKAKSDAKGIGKGKGKEADAQKRKDRKGKQKEE
ncbi:hypothetical protein PLICRDRAFT_33304 [Plicaturopsis crispa FD-325 SS-3]|nr:hypothetical protein PLICRDRAFT_33304 [Plicaturopsis crispa FD-325 SS-3]